MFAKLDDLEGQVELFVRDATSEQAEAIALDRVVLVRGRVDQKGRDQMSVVVHEASPFEPDADELAKARARAKKRGAPERIVPRIDATRFGPELVEESKGLFEAYPGGTAVSLEMATRDGVRRLRFGDGYRVDPDHGLRASWTNCSGRRRACAKYPHMALDQREVARHGECRRCSAFCDKLVGRGAASRCGAGTCTATRTAGPPSATWAACARSSGRRSTSRCSSSPRTPAGSAG